MVVGAFDVGDLVGDDVTGIAVVGARVGAGETVTGSAVAAVVGAALGRSVTSSVGSADGASTTATAGASGTATGVAAGTTAGAVVVSGAGFNVKNGGSSCAAAEKRRNADVINSFMMRIVVVV